MVFLFAGKVVYVAILGFILLVILQACWRLPPRENDIDHILIVVVALTGPAGYALPAILSVPAMLLCPNGVPGDGACSVFEKYEIFLEGILMSGAGYWQWFCLVPRLWRYWRRKGPRNRQATSEHDCN
jgi:hypothetical protein